jgi:uncharacterized protein YecA (UPF0149 family)
MLQAKQAWEVSVETDKAISDAYLHLTKRGMLEWSIMMWLAQYRRDEAKELNSEEAEANLMTAKILEETAKEMEKIGLEASKAGIRSNTPLPPEISEQECERELKEQLLPLLEDGVDEIEILRCMALWRKEFAMAGDRGAMSEVDVQFARSFYAASEKLENALDKWAETDPFQFEPAEISVPIRRELPKIGRNEPCPCGSGKKFKKCHGA